MTLPPFHLAFPVHDLEQARRFYGGLFGCPEGRSSAEWIDFDFFGHQIVAHLVHPSPSGSSGRSAPRADLNCAGRSSPDEGPGVGNVAGTTSPTPTSPPKGRGYNEVDGEHVPVPHFGAVLPMAQWEALAARLQAAEVAFEIEPTVRFRGQSGEQATMFLLDPSGNALEIKAMADPANLFAKQ